MGAHTTLLEISCRGSIIIFSLNAHTTVPVFNSCISRDKSFFSNFSSFIQKHIWVSSEDLVFIAFLSNEACVKARVL